MTSINGYKVDASSDFEFVLDKGNKGACDVVRKEPKVFHKMRDFIDKF